MEKFKILEFSENGFTAGLHTQCWGGGPKYDKIKF